MDRNNFNLPTIIGAVIVVALRKESVDRNGIDRSQLWVDWRSLSARRAWIEILLMWYQCNTVVVALRKESVDRNLE